MAQKIMQILTLNTKVFRSLWTEKIYVKMKRNKIMKMMCINALLLSLYVKKQNVLVLGS